MRISPIREPAVPAITAAVEQLVRRPPEEVFAAFVEPARLQQFWLRAANVPLAPGGKAHWEFMIEGASDDVTVTAFEPARRLAVRWTDRSVTEWTFRGTPDGHTVVRIAQSGFPGSSAEATAAASDATQGYTIVLCGLKVLLETERPALVGDKAELIQQALKAARAAPAE